MPQRDEQRCSVIICCTLQILLQSMLRTVLHGMNLMHRVMLMVLPTLSLRAQKPRLTVHTHVTRRLCQITATK